MLHEDAGPEILRGIKVLRKRIEQEEIPPSKLDETLNVASWNIREFGKMRHKRWRSEAAVHYIAEIINQFDLVAIVELRDDLHDLYRVMDILGPYWHAVFSDFNTDRAGNRERIGYLYDKRAVAFTGLAAEADPPRKKDPATGEYVSLIEWWRSPFMASFRAGTFDFILITAHVRWGGDDEAARVEPLTKLAEWIRDRRKEKAIIDKDIILMGDFNIPEYDDACFEAITKHGLKIPAVLRGMKHGTNLRRDKRYDQILYDPQYTKSFTGVGGALDFFRNNWRELFPKADFPDMASNSYDFTYELSDHLPLWVQLDTWTDDEEIDQKLRMT